MVEFAPPVTPAHVSVTAVPQLVAVSVTGDPLQGRGVVYLYTTAPTYVLFCPTADLPDTDGFAIPYNQVHRFRVSPLSSYFSVGTPTGTADLYWYLAGENSE